MITFSKQNETQAYVLRNYQKIGILETTIGGYLLSINYGEQRFIPEEWKKYIKRIAEMEYKVSLEFQQMHHDSNAYYCDLVRNSIPSEERNYKE